MAEAHSSTCKGCKPNPITDQHQHKLVLAQHNTAQSIVCPHHGMYGITCRYIWSKQSMLFPYVIL